MITSIDKTPRVLIVEDSQSIANLYVAYLRKAGLNASQVNTVAAAFTFIENSPPDLVLLDLRLPDEQGQEILQWIKKKNFPTSVIVITSHASINIVVDVMRSGAEDFLEKPVAFNRLVTTVNNVLEKHRLKYLVAELESSFKPRGYHGFIGSSLPMQRVYKTIDAAAPSKATIFITGESGTGKEVCAEAIHNQSKRASEPFIALNCAAIPHDLMESEIFGHIKGAFTGASSDRQGAATMAHKGTLFLDEVCEMDLDLQAKLLRFIQTGRFQKVGSNKENTVDVRFICATNRDPLVEVQEKRFREDLYYRLHVVPLHLPPLRERGNDIVEIGQKFLTAYAKEEEKNFKSFSTDVAAIFKYYEWPGNVRQLQNVIRNIVVLKDQQTVTQDCLPPPLDSVTPKNTGINSVQVAAIEPVNTDQNTVTPSTHDDTVRPLAVVEREIIEQAIQQCDGNIIKAASLLDVSPSTIYRKKQAWEEANV